MPSAKGEGVGLPDVPWGIISVKAQVRAVQHRWCRRGGARASCPLARCTLAHAGGLSSPHPCHTPNDGLPS